MEPLSQKTAESCPPATEDAGHAPAPSVPDAKPVAEETQAAVALCARIEPSLGYHFRDPVLLLTAFTHPSYTFEHPQTPHNQRLEFLGDAVLGLLLADAVFRRFADSREGELTALRANIASGTALTEIGRARRYGEALRLDKGARQSGGADNAHNLADIIESILGAAWLDGGLPAAQTIFERFFADRLEALVRQPAWRTNPRGHLQTIAQRRYSCEPVYDEPSRTGPDSNPLFHASVSLAGKTGHGTGHSKRDAQAQAAADLLRLFGEEDAGSE